MRVSPFVLCVTVFFLCAGLATGQQSPAAATPRPANSGKPRGGDGNDKEPYVFELIQNKIVFETDGKGYRDFVGRVRIKSESAVREFGLLTYPFASSFESLEVNFARVRKPDGSVVETPTSDIQELD